LRGGAWNNNGKNARAAFRNNDHPDNEWNNNGFRMVVLHSFVYAGSASRPWPVVEAKLAGLRPARAFPELGGRANIEMPHLFR
jgi:hypothetical protein